MEPLTIEQVSLVLQACASLAGIWDDAPRPEAVSHYVIARREDGLRWQLTGEGFPMPSPRLLREIRQIEALRRAEANSRSPL